MIINIYIFSFPNVQTLLNKLEAEKASIQAEIDAGKRLQRERNAPAFIAQTIAELERKWKDTNELAKAKHEKLKVTVCFNCKWQ